MGQHISFATDAPDVVDTLVINLVDPALDAGKIGRLIDSVLSLQDVGVVARFDVDSLIDYRSQRPMLNVRNGRIVAMNREDMSISLAKDVEGRSFLRMYGADPDYQWDSLVSSMFDVIERFHVKHVYSFSAVGAMIPHTRPVDMFMRTSGASDTPVLDADFWMPASFSSYFEYHARNIGIDVVNITARIPAYVVGNQYPAAAGVLGMASEMSGISFPVGDLEQSAQAQEEELNELVKDRAEFAAVVESFEREYDSSENIEGFIQGPQHNFSVPSVEEIGRAAELFLGQVTESEQKYTLANDETDGMFDPQGLLERVARLRDQYPRRAETSMPPRLSFEHEESENSVHTADEAEDIYEERTVFSAEEVFADRSVPLSPRDNSFDDDAFEEDTYIHPVVELDGFSDVSVKKDTLEVDGLKYGDADGVETSGVSKFSAAPDEQSISEQQEENGTETSGLSRLLHKGFSSWVNGFHPRDDDRDDTDDEENDSSQKGRHSF